MALVRDPWFWRRFSRAVHLDEEVRTPTDEKETTIWSDNWLDSQRRKRRKSALCGCLICVAIAVFIAAVVVVIWWFWAHNWLQDKPS
ncbi:hypothetical protein ASPSYDRAFT_93862 [Aspergillus sydowii CBS 593.65]|uniref:Uncharacterized protein n=1 Tax=Aspergillus sydowii CBS 593.65 TaxID=1036612 RepID=A0A1L9T424_9EURO|nr:uncharacterized protein ASPSYDRAFT_93862 [Aspergillus sydowii CBS 593.65]OJJ54101.1 hypothetical protein ASPSYDRAFT_93862 [Aspergillus sydowii CBS 593.65]